MTSRNSLGRLFGSVDRWAVALYAAAVCVGFVLIAAASYDDSGAPLFALSHFYMKQAVWIGIAAAVAVAVLLIDASVYHKYAWFFYFAGLCALGATLVLGREVNGAKAWFEIGGMRIQPVEFVKIAVALAVARVMSASSFSIARVGNLFRVGMVIFAPLLIIVLQNDTGSGIVLSSLLFVLYREGLNKWICIPVLLVAVLFIFSFLFTPMTLLVALVLICTLSEAMLSGRWRSRLIYLAALGLAAALIYIGMHFAFPAAEMDLYRSLLVAVLGSLPVVAVYAFRANLRNIFLLVALLLGSLILLPTTDYIFNSVLKEHQQNRILSFLGIVSDPLGTDYNVNQAKIAIGSGGFWGKGFLNGTQIKYGFVPEKHTDFIFCTAGEEWGFVGAMVVLGIFCALIFRLMRMGERQEEAFGRIYCYSVAAFLLFHLLVNIGMTVGLMPVMGIPLPFVSYGGSSLVAFTMMLFIAIRLDAQTRSFAFENRYS